MREGDRVIELAAARALYKAAVDPNRCWADDERLIDGKTAIVQCHALADDPLGLCPRHREALFGLGPASQPRRSA